MSEWISLKDRFPTEEECTKDYGWFLVCSKDSLRADMSRYDGRCPDRSYEHGWKYAWNHNITHWMPLPKLPGGT